MTGIKIFEGFERKIKRKISQTRIKEEVRKDVKQKEEKHGRKLWRTRRSFGKKQPDGEAWLLDNSLKGLVARQLT
jgi:hypothetical protein